MNLLNDAYKQLLNLEVLWYFIALFLVERLKKVFEVQKNVEILRSEEDWGKL